MKGGGGMGKERNFEKGDRRDRRRRTGNAYPEYCPFESSHLCLSRKVMESSHDDSQSETSQSVGRGPGDEAQLASEGNQGDEEGSRGEGQAPRTRSTDAELLGKGECSGAILTCLSTHRQEASD